MIEVKNLWKRYSGVTALGGISLSVARGQSRPPSPGTCTRQIRDTLYPGAAMPLKYGSTGASPFGGTVVLVHSRRISGMTSGA